MADEAQLKSLIEPVVERLGYRLVRVSLQGSKRSQSLQVMAETPETGQLTLDDCAKISRALSDMLDEVDPIEDEYRLEVSSPGIDRPLTRPHDYQDWAGHEAKVTLVEPIDGRKRFQGKLLGLVGDDVRIDVPGLGETLLPLASIHNAKLVLTDELIKATVPLRADDADEIEEE